MTDKYVAAHINTKGPGDARPTALQIVRDDNLEGALTGKVALVTGCSSGIGIETARALKATGAHVYATARDLEKGKEALADILEPGKLDLIHLDMDSLEGVRQCAKEFLSKSDKLNILVNNAGIMACPEGRTKDGFELQFGTNHLAHFLFFNLLKPTLLASSTPDFHSRVVNVASTGHRWGQINFENLTLEGEYDPMKSYGQAKTSNIYMANEIERRYGSKGLHGYSLHPGGIWTGLQKYVPQEQMDVWTAVPEVATHTKSPEQGAATQVWAAVGKVWEGKGGVYLEDCTVSPPVKPEYSVLHPGYESWAYNPEGEQKLWKVSLELVGLKDDD